MNDCPGLLQRRGHFVQLGCIICSAKIFHLPQLNLQLRDGEEVATCPSCSLIVKVIYDVDDFLECDEIPAPATNVAIKQTN